MGAAAVSSKNSRTRFIGVLAHETKGHVGVPFSAKVWLEREQMAKGGRTGR